MARGDGVALAYGKSGKADALARAGRVEEANELMVPAVEVLIARDSLALSIAYGHLGFVRVQASDYSGARAALEKSRDRVIRTYCPFEFVGPTFPLLVESLLGPGGSTLRAGRAERLPEKLRVRLVLPVFSAGGIRTTGPTPCA